MEECLGPLFTIILLRVPNIKFPTDDTKLSGIVSTMENVVASI